MIAWFWLIVVGLAVGQIMFFVGAAFGRSGQQADCESCEYRNWYFTHTCNKAK